MRRALPDVLTALLLVACSAWPLTVPAATPETAREMASVVQYTCPMHPHYLSTDPEGRCPLCGMALVPVERTDQDSTVVSVASDMLQTLGVRLGPVRYETLGQDLRAFGVVAPDERLETVSVSRLEGWIDGLTVRAEGEAVAAGALLYRVYSPTLLAAQKDFLNALASGSRSRIEGSRQRLRSLGMQAATLDRLGRERTVIERLPIYAETAGVVAALSVRDGDYVEPGTPVLRLQSYEQVWILASIPERDLAGVEAGLAVRVEHTQRPGDRAQQRHRLRLPDH